MTMGDEVTRRTSMSFNINAGGGVSIRERVDRPPLNTAELLGQDVDNIDFGIDIRRDEDGGVFVDLSAHHMKDEASGRVFHCSMTVVLSVADIKRLHGYLDFILASGLDGISDD